MPRQIVAPVTDEQRDTFLEALRDGLTVTDATTLAGVSSKGKLHRLRRADPEFAAAWADAWHEGTDALEAEAQRRAVEGVVTRERFDAETGNLIERVITYSDKLLELLLKARRPERYRDRYDVDLTAGGKEIKIVVAPQLADIFGVTDA